MEINANLNPARVSNAGPTPRRAPAAQDDSTTGSHFTSSAALETALKNSPDVRSEAVERAKALLNDPGYPSADTVKKLSSFLAGKLASSPE